MNKSKDHSPINLKNINNNNISIKLANPIKKQKRKQIKHHTPTDAEIQEALSNLEYNDQAYTTQISHGGSISYGSGGNLQLPQPHAILNRSEPEPELYKTNATLKFHPEETPQDLQKSITESLQPYLKQYSQDRNKTDTQFKQLKDYLTDHQFMTKLPATEFVNPISTSPPETIQPINEPIKISKPRGRPPKIKPGVVIRSDRNEGIPDDETFIKTHKVKKSAVVSKKSQESEL